MCSAIRYLTLLLLLCWQPLCAQVFSTQFKPFKGPVRHYVVYQAPVPPVIDGKGNEAAWQQAEWTADFRDIEGDGKPAPAQRTRVKMLWDATHLYILAEMEETDVWGSLLRHDTIIFHDNDFEVFLDPDGDAHQYYEIEVNALNTVMDLFMPRPYRNGGNALLTWDVKGLRTAVHVDGTLNRPGDKDRAWTVEMAVPFQSLGFHRGRSAPRDSATWRVNFSRVHWDTDVVNGRYVKRPGRPEHNWVWSPQEVINMLAPERWGYLQFCAQHAGTARAPFREPATAAAERILWEVYYLQQQYHRQHRRYAADVATLGMQQPAMMPVIEATSAQFTAVIRNAGAITVINHEGKITTRHE